MEARDNRHRELILIGLILLLVAASLIAVSCGKKTAGTPAESSGATVTTGIQEADTYTSESDAAVKTASPGDFSDSRLSDSALGL
jgi:hypothetical protein